MLIATTGIALALAVALALVIRSKRRALAAAAVQLAAMEVKVKDAEASASRWYSLSPVRWLITNYLEALREYEIIADGGGDEEDYAPDRLAGQPNDWEGQEVARTEEALRLAVLAIVHNASNETSAATIAERLETEMNGQSGGGYRHSMHRALRESWCGLFTSLVAQPA